MNEIANVLNKLNIDEKNKSILLSLFEQLLFKIDALSNEIAELKKVIAEKDQIIEIQAQIIKVQKNEIKELQRQLNMNSNNSSLPPSKDKYKSDKKDDNNKSNLGGKKGHIGTTLKQIANPDRVKKIMVEKCICGSSDLRITGKYEARQEFGVEINKVVTEYRLVQCKCGSCGRINKPESLLPKNAFYSESVKAYAVYMLDRHFMSYERLKELFSDMFNLSIAEGSINNWRREFATRLGKKYLVKLKSLLLKADYINADETGINVAGKNIWAHVNCNEKYTLLNASNKRGSEGITSSGILDKYTGFVIADGWSSYKSLSTIRGIQSCFAHLFRYCKDIHENYNQKWAKAILDFLHQFITQSKELCKSGIMNFTSKLRIKYNMQYDQILKKAKKELLQYDYARNHHTWRFLKRLERDKNSILRFLRHTFLPLTNNEAERSLRPLKIKQKISGTSVSMKTMQENLDIRSFISTTKKQRQKVLNAIIKLFKNSSDFILV